MYGRLADPDSTIGTDPRSDPRMVAALAPLALDGRFPQPALTVDAPLEERLAFVVETEENTGAFLDMFAQSVPIVEGVTTTTTTIAGTDGNDVTLYVSRPDASGGALPCVVHLHGGAMAFLSAADTVWPDGREWEGNTQYRQGHRAHLLGVTSRLRSRSSSSASRASSQKRVESMPQG